MSKMIWGIGHLVDNPSSTLISTLRKHIFSRESEDITVTAEVTTRNDITVVPNKEAKEESAVQSTSKLPKQICSKNLEEHKVRLKSVKVGTEENQQSHKEVQCVRSRHKNTCCKTTSVSKVLQVDRNIATPSVVMKNAHTEPQALHICKDHQHAIELLRKWAAVEKRLAQKTKTPNKVTLIKAYLKAIVKLLKLERIQNVPQYRSMETMKLYKAVSVEETQMLKVKKVK